MSVSLAITACVTLLPTKVNAATLTILPNGETQKDPGDSINFIFVLEPAPFSVVRFRGFGFNRDSNELSMALNGGFTFPLNGLITRTTTVLSRTFTVLTPVKDGSSDLNGFVFYDESSLSGDSIGLISTAIGADVVPLPLVPVPEPATIFGTVTALGCGTLFRRKSVKKKKS
jgi:hypothetical protein